jgi:hypothetical protein
VVSRRRHRRGHVDAVFKTKLKITEDAGAPTVDSGGGDATRGGTSLGSGEAKPRNARRFA